MVMTVMTMMPALGGERRDVRCPRCARRRRRRVYVESGLLLLLLLLLLLTYIYIILYYIIETEGKGCRMPYAVRVRRPRRLRTWTCPCLSVCLCENVSD